jgi:hypothetical protein
VIRRGVVGRAGGWLYTRPAPDFGMLEADASFITQMSTCRDGWFMSQILRWELWSV